jgi:hypothetical protein
VGCSTRCDVAVSLSLRRAAARRLGLRGPARQGKPFATANRVLGTGRSGRVRLRVPSAVARALAGVRRTDVILSVVATGPGGQSTAERVIVVKGRR